jgi:bifunctional DNA-binding transcriptional regulator/antitoxin component of YhaV-PrlF toxin-antitoxin module
MEQISVRVEKTGRILLPVALRRKLKLVEGESTLILRVEDGNVELTTPQAAIEWVQREVQKHISAGTSLSDELIADRRREAAAEDAE